MAVPTTPLQLPRMRPLPRVLAAALLLALAAPARAQEAAEGGPRVGDPAPDFTLPASTQAGPIARPIRLADFKGQVVVIAFFPKSRTKG